MAAKIRCTEVTNQRAQGRKIPLRSLNEGFNSKEKVARSVGGKTEGKEQGRHG